MSTLSIARPKLGNKRKEPHYVHAGLWPQTAARRVCADAE